MSDTRPPSPVTGRAVATPNPIGAGLGARMAAQRAAPLAGPSPHAIELVRRSWAAVMPISDAAASLFYERLFELDPSVRPLFKSDLREQKKKLMQTLAVAVDGLSNLDRLAPVLRALGARHAGYMVQDRHYDLVGQALLWTLREGLGNAFTPEVEAAWASVYGLIAQTMKAAAPHQQESAGGAPPAGAGGFYEAPGQRPGPEPRSVTPVHVPEAWSAPPARASESERASVSRLPASASHPAEARPLVVQFGAPGQPTLQVRVAIEAPPPARAPSAGDAPAREGLAAGMLLGTLCLLFSMLASALVAIALLKSPSPGVIAGVPLAALALGVTSFAFGYLWGRPKGGAGRGR
jgi:hemoglobin-like flavoprotein